MPPTQAGREQVECTCGALNDVAFGTCIRCGKKLGAADEAPAPPPPRARSSEAPPTIGVAGLVLGGLCALVFAMQLSMSLRRGDGIPILGGGNELDLLRIGVLKIAPKAVALEPFRLFSAVFVHFGVLHFGMNMYGFAQLTRVAEALVGTARTMTTFVATGVFGFAATAIMQIFVTRQIGGLTAGASGGILGVMGLILGVMIRTKNPAWRPFAWNILFFGVMFGFAVSGSSTGISVNNTAHIGGVLSGLALGLVWGRTDAREGWLSRGLAGLLVLLSVGSLLLAQRSDLPWLLS